MTEPKRWIATTHMLLERLCMTESLYIVWCPTGDNPLKRHANVDDARKEARRLCEQNHGREFFVMRAVESVQYRTDPYVCRNYSK